MQQDIKSGVLNVPYYKGSFLVDKKNGYDDGYYMGPLKCSMPTWLLFMSEF